MDDISIMTTDKNMTNLANTMQLALNRQLAWCDQAGLMVNPNKTVLIPFTLEKKTGPRPINGRPRLDNLVR